MFKLHKLSFLNFWVEFLLNQWFFMIVCSTKRTYRAKYNGTIQNSSFSLLFTFAFTNNTSKYPHEDNFRHWINAAIIRQKAVSITAHIIFHFTLVRITTTNPFHNCHEWDEIWILERTFWILNTPGRHASFLQLSQRGNIGLACYADSAQAKSDCST